MKHPFLLLFSLLLLASPKSGAWQLEWIASPSAAEGEQTLFCRTYDFEYTPEKARIAIAALGRFVLYVNGYNVSTAVMEPGPDSPDSLAATMRTYDVTHLLHYGANTLAVWYAPSPAPSEAHGSRGGIALAFYGTRLDGRPFSYSADGSWLSHSTGCYIYNNVYETGDATLGLVDWKNGETPSPAWQGAEKMTAGIPKTLRVSTQEHYIAHTLAPISTTQLTDSTLVCHFPRAFLGWVRLTLRGMERGATLTVNGLSHVCSGETDEQCCRRFSLIRQQDATITLPRGASEACIFSVEGIEIGTRLRTGWHE